MFSCSSFCKFASSLTFHSDSHINTFWYQFSCKGWQKPQTKKWLVTCDVSVMLLRMGSKLSWTLNVNVDVIETLKRSLMDIKT